MSIIHERPTEQRRIAVVGAGVSGLAAALRLAPGADVTLFERDLRLGGHADTQQLRMDAGTTAVDTGFIVFNHRTYPHLTELFDRLAVPTAETEMSFSVRCDGCGLEFAGGTLGKLVRSLARRPAAVRLLTGILAFRRAGRRSLHSGVPSALTLRDWATRAGIDDATVAHYLVPLTAAVWSTAPGLALDMPADTTLRFLDHHGLLGGRPPRWRTVRGGSRVYVDAVRTELARAGAEIRTGEAITSVRRTPDGAQLTDSTGAMHEFDQVVIACHADDALALLDDPTPLERQVLGAWSYTDNAVVLHTDPTPLPRDSHLWASWNYHLPDCDARSGPPRLNYQMNILQHIERPLALTVSVNPAPDSVAPHLVHRQLQYRHPQYDLAARAAQSLVPELHREGSVTTNTFFCGAWQGYGFHEDGLRSGYEAADAALEVRLTEPTRAVVAR